METRKYNKPALAATGETTRARIREVRLSKGLTVREVAARLDEIGYPLEYSTVSKIEGGTRRVDVDTLMAFACALGVSPLALLLPETKRPGDTAEATGFPQPATANDLWDFACAQASPFTTGDTEHEAYMAASTPYWYSIIAGLTHEVDAIYTERSARAAGLDDKREGSN